jgi:hypothetical protein
MTIKSPFYVIQEFISPMMCEHIVALLDWNVPDTDMEGKPIKTIKSSERPQNIIYERLVNVFPEIQAYYEFLYKGTENIIFEWFPEESKGNIQCENSSYLRRKWLRTKQRDFTGVLFLSDYQEKIPFDNEYEVYGGKLEFPQHRFGFNPQRGTLIFFPSGPHFLNITTQIYAGDLYQARIQIAAHTPYLYDPRNFPGDYQTWFTNLK